MKIIKTIIKRNIKKIKTGQQSISISLLTLLLDETELVSHKPFLIGKAVEGFIPLEDIPKEILEHISLPHNINQYHDQFPQAQIDEGASDPNTFASRLLVIDVINSLNNWSYCKHEFEDAFTDENTIIRKAKTLSVLRILTDKVTDKYFLRLAFDSLKEADSSFDLTNGSFSEFYDRVIWYKRVGLVNGCLHND